MADLAAVQAALAHVLTVVEKLGEGGEGEVFLCRTLVSEEAASRGETARTVALKLLHEGRGPDLEKARELRHPAIVEVLGTGEALGRSYVLLDYFPGTPLRALLARGPLPATDLRAVFGAVAAALEHAHERGVIHQDVKPENVLVAPSASGLAVKLSDFGLAADVGESDRRALLASRSVRSQDAAELRSLAGTLPYLAPERLSEKAPPPHPRVDVFSLGVLVFEALTGRAPGGLELPSELRPGIDPRWDAVLKRALARDPARRHPSIAAFRADAEPLLLGGSDSARLSRGGAASPSGRHARPEKPADDLVAIPQSRFRMGEPHDADARPVRTIALPAFLVDRTPVTIAAYHAFVAATGARAPASWAERGIKPRRLPSALALLPVTGVTWDEACAFAAWVGKRLPTEAEWERVARGRSSRAYPYGDRFDSSRIHAALGPVDAHPGGASDEGILDLTGNAWEWCADWFAPYDPGDVIAPTGPARGQARVIRGGWDPSSPGSGSAWFRGMLRPDVADARVGFRCVRDA